MLPRPLFVAVLCAMLAIGAFTAPAAAAPASRADIVEVAHRGDSGIAPENTLVAVEAAIEHDARWVEVDVQRSSDGAIVLLHDTTLDRTTNARQVFPGRPRYNVEDFSLAELRQLDAGSWFHASFAGEGVSTLGELVDVMGLRAGLLLEVKRPAVFPGIEAQVLDELAAAGYLAPALAAGKLVVQSFDHASMRRIAELDARVPVGLLQGSTPTDAQLADAAAFATEYNLAAGAVNAHVVQRAHDLGLRVGAYTVDSGREMRRLANLGVDAIITNYPLVARDILRAPIALPPRRAGAAPYPATSEVAHRGSSGAAPENTIAAVNLAMRQQARWFEVDVQRTSDGHIVLLHDTTLTRTTDVEEVYPDRSPWLVAQFTLAELRALDAGSWFSEDFSGEGLPTLAELIDIVGADIGLLLEVKNPELYPGIEADLVEALGHGGYLDAAVASGDLVVQSFNHASMRLLSQLDDRIPVGLLYIQRPTLVDLTAAATYAAEINPSAALLDQATVELIQDLGMKVRVYTVNSGRDMRRLMDWGVDGMITDYPLVAADIALRPPTQVDPTAGRRTPSPSSARRHAIGVCTPPSRHFACAG